MNRDEKHPYSCLTIPSTVVPKEELIMVIINAAYDFVNVVNFDTVRFDTNSEQNKTYLKVFFVDTLGKDNLVYAEVDKVMSKEEKFKVAELLAVIDQKFKHLDEEILTEYLNNVVK